MNIHRHSILLVGFFIAALLLAPIQQVPLAYAQGNVLAVTPLNLQGWVIAPDPPGAPVPYDFISGIAATGSGSLRMGPISGANANKLILYPPYAGQPASGFSAFSYGYYVDPASTAAGNDSDHLYVNVYVDSAANGVGTYATWYDCRYDFVPPVIGAGVWGSASFNAGFTGWANIANPGGICPTSIGALPAGSLIMFMAMNAGDTSGNDNGLLAYYDQVSITHAGATTTYDFEPTPPPQVGGTFGYLDQRINYLDIAAPVAVYAWNWGTDANGEPRRGLILYAINENSRGYEVLQVPPDVIEAVPEMPEHNTRLAQTTRDGLRIEVWRLSSGEFHVQVWQPNGKRYVLLFRHITPDHQPYTSFETP